MEVMVKDHLKKMVKGLLVEVEDLQEVDQVEEEGHQRMKKYLLNQIVKMKLTLLFAILCVHIMIMCHLQQVLLGKKERMKLILDGELQQVVP